MEEHLATYMSYINNILVNVKRIQLIELQVVLRWEQGAERGSVATWCCASGLLVAC
jgi:hypothetical protein